MWCSWIGNAGGCSRAPSAVDVEYGSGDVGGVRAREERDAGGHLLGTRVTTQRGGRGSGRGELAVGRVHLGVDQSGLQDVDRDPARPEVTRRAARVTGERRLGGRVFGHPGEADARARAGADGDDSAAFTHVLDRLADAGDDPGVVHGPLAIKLADVERGIVDWTLHDDRGVVDEDVQAAKLADNLADQLRSLLGVALVGVERRGAYAFGLELLDDRLSAIGGRVVADRDFGAVIGEPQRGRRADAS